MSSSISTSIVRSGARSLRANPTAATGFGLLSPSSVAQLGVARFYLYVASHPNADTVVAGYQCSGTTTGLAYKAADGKYYPGMEGAVFGTGGLTLQLAHWYRIDLRVNASVNPRLVDVQIDGVALPQLSTAIAAASLLSISLGPADTNVTCDLYFDDLLLSETTADYPMGEGAITLFVPTADGTHNVAGTGDFQRGNTAVDILNATTTAWQLIDDVPLPSGTVDEVDNQRAVAPVNATDYVECVFGPFASAAPSGPRGLSVCLAHHEIATGSCNFRVALNDNGTVNDVLNLTAAGVVSYRRAAKFYALAPTGGAWTITSGAGNFNNLRLRFYSSDATPDVCLDAILVEAEFAPPAVGRSRLLRQAVKRAAHY